MMLWVGGCPKCEEGEIEAQITGPKDFPEVEITRGPTCGCQHNEDELKDYILDDARTV